MTSLVIAGPRLTHIDPFGPTSLDYTRTYSPPKAVETDRNRVQLRAMRAARELQKARAAVRTYNRLMRQIGLIEAAQHSLHGRLSLLLEDTPHIAVIQTCPPRPAPIFSPRRPPSDSAELREIARKHRVPPTILWQRFPPTNEVERKQMLKDLGKADTSVSEEVKAFRKWLRQRAKDDARPGVPAEKLLSSTEWCAAMKKEYDEIVNIELEFDL